MKKETLVYESYPDNMSDAEILECIRSYNKQIVENRALPDVVTQMAPMIQMGHYELEKRQIKRITRISLALSGISIIVAGVALFIAIENSHTSNEWKDDQIIILKEIKNEIINIKKSSLASQKHLNLNVISKKNKNHEAQK